MNYCENWIKYTEAFEYVAHHIHSVSAWARICCRVLEVIGRAKLDHKLRAGVTHNVKS